MTMKPQLSEEWGRIPTLAKVLAALLPICAIAFFLVVRSMTPRGVPGIGERGPTIFQLFLFVVPLLAGVLFALWILLVGYVYADAGRRGMRRFLWMLVVIFVPNALGFILYFLLRQPVGAQCPGCGQILSDDVAYCPQCGTQVAQSCPKCARPIKMSDRFCSACGENLKSAAMPAH